MALQDNLESLTEPTALGQWKNRWKLCAWSSTRAIESHDWFFLNVLGIFGTMYH